MKQLFSDIGQETVQDYDPYDMGNKWSEDYSSFLPGTVCAVLWGEGTLEEHGTLEILLNWDSSERRERVPEICIEISLSLWLNTKLCVHTGKLYKARQRITIGGLSTTSEM